MPEHSNHGSSSEEMDVRKQVGNIAAEGSELGTSIDDIERIANLVKPPSPETAKERAARIINPELKYIRETQIRRTEIIEQIVQLRKLLTTTSDTPVTNHNEWVEKQIASLYQELNALEERLKELDEQE